VNGGFTPILGELFGRLGWDRQAAASRRTPKLLKLFLERGELFAQSFQFPS